MKVPALHAPDRWFMRLEVRAIEPRYRTVCTRCGAKGPWVEYAHGDGRRGYSAAWDTLPDCKAGVLERIRGAA